MPVDKRPVFVGVYLISELFWKPLWAFNRFPFSWEFTTFRARRCVRAYRWLLCIGIHGCVCQDINECVRACVRCWLLMGRGLGGVGERGHGVTVSRWTSGLPLLFGHCLTLIPANQGWVMRGDRWHHHYASLLLTPSGCTHLRLSPAGKRHLRVDL